MFDWSCVAVVLSVAIVIAYFIFQNKTKKEVHLRKKDWTPDTVYLYQFPRLKTLPNISPYCLKVETFLKLNNIPYEVCTSLVGRSKYGLLPFIEFNGEHIADSQIIINRLKDHFKVKPLPSLRDDAIARTIERTAECNTSMLHCKFKMAENTDKAFFSSVVRDFGCPPALLNIFTPIVTFLLQKKATKRVLARFGEFSIEECKEFLQKDYDAYRDLLYDWKFFFGDEITTTDCTVFAQLATVLYLPGSNYAKELLQNHYPELVAYCDRVRDTVFGEDFTME